ncbi:LOW QUALITY PROTEIN: uncharacterized protein Dvir_GJ26961 [Drosophila virilis]|uniref:G-protein coupled receptors family 2 profile 2 domain-containing protein n=1 Tax=Drosophila virilis TaxID=7244 RepID=A0A0Q9W7X4_DROVI|nr:LOW QUALITY PROTEIN: uncharacterized protein Dvir_GJ26961 [Drosophila virilis]
MGTFFLHFTKKETASGTAYWKFRGVRYTTSEDILCWKDHWELFLRECNTTTGQWLPEKVVCKPEENINKYCPEDLVEIYDDKGDPLCFKISSKPQKYDDNFCHGSNKILPLDISKHQIVSFTQFLYEKNVSEYWLPIQRENSYMPYKIRLPGDRWGQIVNDNINLTDLRSDKKCMSVRYYHRLQQKNDKKESSDFIINITDCEDLLHSICIYQDNLIARSGCPEGEGALTYRPHECYGVNWQKILSTEQNSIRIKEYFSKRNSLRMLLSEFLPREKKNEFFQVDNFVDKFGDEYVILMNRNEVVQVVSHANNKRLPILYKNTIDRLENPVELILKVDITLQALILIVYNGDYIWRINKNDNGVQCFTNADYDLQRSTKIDLIWENKSKTKSIFKLKLLGDGPGEYWCEGHTIFDFNFVTTQRVVATKEQRGHSFAMKINIPCIIETKNEYTNMCNNIYKNIKKLGKHVLKVLRERSSEVSRDLNLHNSRIMDIEEIATQNINCWVHLTASLKNSAVDNSEEESSQEDNSLENDNNVRHDTSVRMQVWTLLKELLSLYSPNNSIVIRSSEYCFPIQFNLNNDTYQWKQAVIGQVGTLSRLCLQTNGMPYTRHCLGNFTHGAYWETLKGNISCQLNEYKLKITKTLYSLTNSKMLKATPARVVKKVKDILQEYAGQVLPVDIHFTADIVQASVKSLDQFVLSLPKKAMGAELVHADAVLKDITRDLIYIYNYLINVKETTIRMSAELNSTNKLLEAFEIAMNTFSSQTIFNKDNVSGSIGNSNELEPRADFEVLDYEDIGVSVKISPNLLYFIINPLIANISGIAIFKNDNNTTELPYLLNGAFKNEHYRFLQSNHEIEDFIYEPNLQLATYVPEKLLGQLDANLNTLNVTEVTNSIVIIKVYSNDKLFQSQANHISQSALGRVVSISLPGHSTHLPEELPLAFRLFQSDSSKHNKTKNMCGYWNFEKWASDGIQVSSLSEMYEDIVLCQVSHLTPFAYLVGFNFTVEEDIEVNIQQIHDQALDIITVIGCTLSLLGISGIFITAAIFNSWRQKPSSKVLLQLSAAIALQMIILCFVNTEEYSLHLIINKIIPSCVAIGALLHYSVLVQFFWMMVIAYLQFKRYVHVFGGTRPNRFFIKSTALCWGVPVIPVVLVILLDSDSFSQGAICYPSGYALYFGIIMPISIIIIANFIIFCLIIYNILGRSSTPIRHTDKPVLIYQIRLSVLLFFLLGFTWFFGFLSTIKVGIVFSYLFCLTATLQGFVIFIYFIILDPVTRRMWRKFFYELCSNKSYLQSTGTIKDTTQSY